MSPQELEALDELKFELTKVGVEITDEAGFAFTCIYRGHVTAVHEPGIASLVARYLALPKQDLRRQLLKSVAQGFLDDGGAAPASTGGR